MTMVEKQKCEFCGKSSFSYSTEQEGNSWVWEKICENCGKTVEKQTLKK